MNTEGGASLNFDLAVWHCESALAERKASRLYESLCRKEQAPGLTASPAVDLFYRQLTAKWPEIEAVPKIQRDDKDLCPWACALDHSDKHVLMSAVWPKAEDVYLYVQELARLHGLVCYDPQSEEVYLPE